MVDLTSEGIALYKTGSYEDALVCFLGIPEKNDDGQQNLDLAYYIGLCYAKLNRFDEALLYLEQVVTAGTDVSRVYQCRMILAIMYIKTGRMRLADFELHKLLENSFESVQIYATLAFIAWEQEKTDDAIKHYQQAFELDSGNPNVLNGLGYVLCVSNKDLTQSLRFCKQAVDLRPENAAYLDSLGWVYYKLGMMTEARTYLRRASEKAPDNDVIKKHLFEVLNEV